LEQNESKKILTLKPLPIWVQPNQTSGLCLPVVQSVAGMAEDCLPMKWEVEEKKRKILKSFLQTSELFDSISLANQPE